MRAPFAALEQLLPPLRLAGCPVRMAVVVYLTGGVLAGLGLEALLESSSRAKVWAIVLVMGLVIEYWPRALPETDPAVPAIVTAMATLPRGGAVHDVERVVPDTAALYFQTVHGLPQTNGYISRIPDSVLRRDREIDRLSAAGEWQALCEEYGVRYLLLPAGHAPTGSLADAAPVVEGSGLRVFDAGARWTCRRVG